MKFSMKRVWATLLVLVMICTCLTACGNKGSEENTTPTPVPTQAPANNDSQSDATAPTDEPAAPTQAPEVTDTPSAPAEETPLVVGYSPFSQKFSPFYADTGYDQDVVGMTQLGLMTTDRMGGIIYNAIEGETVNYNGTDYFYKGIANLSVNYDEATDITTYAATIRDDIKFSDGTPMTADDIIFNYYAFLDPSYTGSTTLGSYDIIGLQDYQTQTTSDIYNKYSAVAQAIYAAGADHVWSDADSWTADDQAAFWAQINAAWATHTGVIVDYVYNNYASYADAGYCGPYTSADLKDNRGLQIAFGMTMWGFGEVDANGVCTGALTGTTWDMAAGVYPTLEDYAKEAAAKYGNDPVAYYNTETVGAGEADVLKAATNAFISAAAANEPELADGIPNISGIKKTGPYSIEVKVNGYSAPAVYSILGISVAPLHYYGDVAQYDYDNNKFGFEFGKFDLSTEQQTKPLGAGPYKYIKYENRVVYFEANENYWLGCPKIKYIQFKEVDAAEMAAAVKAGTVDAGEMTGSKTKFQEVQSYNSNAEITGNIITTSKVDNLGYGYIGICADNVKVGDDPASEASKNLRKAIATVLSVYRDLSIDSYYGEAASVIQYPISNTSWAAPQVTDEGYKVAFSTAVDGSAIFNSSMSQTDKYAAALAAAVEYFKAAGYTYDEASGKLTAAPEGAKLSYEATIPGDGIADHPSFAVLQDASAALATIGFEMKVNDLSDSSILWEMLDASTDEIWCAAWGSTIDPDMYQVYHSSGVVGEGGSDSNHYHIRDNELDSLILAARESDDQSYRKSVYKDCLDIIIDWAVEVPVYQRQNCIIFSTERINIDTLTPDITTFWGWMNDIELLEMR